MHAAASRDKFLKFFYLKLFFEKFNSRKPCFQGTLAVDPVITGTLNIKARNWSVSSAISGIPVSEKEPFVPRVAAVLIFDRKS